MRDRSRLLSPHEVVPAPDHGVVTQTFLPVDSALPPPAGMPAARPEVGGGKFEGNRHYFFVLSLGQNKSNRIFLTTDGH